jgi:hypothetical protein
MTIRPCVTILALSLALVGWRTASAAEGFRGEGPTPPRVSYLDGDVSFWRPGAEDWAPAKVNTPLAPGDTLYAGDRANVEVQLAPRVFVRGGAGTQVGLATLEDNFVQFQVTAGHAAIDLREPEIGRTIEIDTPQGAFTIDQPGYYRVDVDQDRTMFISRRAGKASVIPASGQETDVAPDTQVVLQGNDENAQLSTGGAPELDDWDRWNSQRGDSLGQPRSARYVPRGVSGTDELDRNGSWHDDPQYGSVWTPTAVPADWAPYSAGRWVWDPYYGWSWVDDAPWGWAPFHYGRWVSAGGGWAWAPGPLAVAPVYAPALVAFFGAPGVGISVSVGLPLVSWVALGFGEPLIPWWGPVGFLGRCWWGGWGGPHIVNNVVIQRNTYVNVRNVTVYRNTQIHNAVIGVHRDQFGRPGGEHVRLSPADARRLRPVRGNLPIHPVAGSLVPTAGHGVRPPQAIGTRRVVATRPAQDPRPHLQASGLRPAATPAPPARLVQPGRGVTAPRQGGHAAAAGEHLTPPPPPRAGHGTAPPAATQRPVPPSHAERQPPGSTPHVSQPPRRGMPPASGAERPGTHAAPPAERRTAPPPARPAPAPGYPRAAPRVAGPAPRGAAPRPHAPARQGHPRHP